MQVYKYLYSEGMREEKKQSLIRKNDYLRQRMELHAVKSRR
ncbi:MAG: hypothetical protein ACI9LA_000511 [Bacteroidia bacterium]